MKYFRVHTADIAYITKQPRGIFTAIGKLAGGKLLCIKALKQDEASAGEYRQAEKNKNVERSIEEQELQRVEHIEFKSGNKSDVKVTLVFPTIADKRAETEFRDRLKEIYLKKIETRAMQKEGSAVESSPTGKSVDLNNTKEENPLRLQGQSHFASQNKEDVSHE